MIEQTELTAVEVEIPDESFEDRVWKIRRALAFTFSTYRHAAEVTVTDGRQSGTFTLGSDDYDLDNGCHRTEPIPITEAGDVQDVIEEVAQFTPPYRSDLPPKGIVPLDAEVERLLQANPGIKLKFRGVRMPWGRGKSVNYYSGRQNQ